MRSDNLFPCLLEAGGQNKVGERQGNAHAADEVATVMNINHAHIALYASVCVFIPSLLSV